MSFAARVAGRGVDATDRVVVFVCHVGVGGGVVPGEGDAEVGWEGMGGVMGVVCGVVSLW